MFQKYKRSLKNINVKKIKFSTSFEQKNIYYEKCKLFSEECESTSFVKINPRKNAILNKINFILLSIIFI